MIRFAIAALFILVSGCAMAQPINATSTTTGTSNITQTGGANLLGTAGTLPSSADPCAYAKKSSVSIAVSSAATTQLIAVSGSTTPYICGFDFTIAASATSAATAQLEYGTATNCTGTHALTGTYGSGDAAASTTPAYITRGDGQATVLATAASQGVCIVTAGTTVLVQGSLTYVQQ